MNFGWENLQSFADFTTLEPTDDNYIPVKYYEYRLNLYSEVQFYLQSQFSIHSLYYNELSVYLPKFKAATFFNLIVNGDFEVCPGLGFEW